MSSDSPELSGKAWKYGDDVDTDVIIPARYLNTSDPAELASHCMEDIDASFASKVAPGDFIVAGKNFGCGSSREHAPIAITASGASAVIARSFARIFYRNAFNMGLPIFEAPTPSTRSRRGIASPWTWSGVPCGTRRRGRSTDSPRSRRSCGSWWLPGGC